MLSNLHRRSRSPINNQRAIRNKSKSPVKSNQLQGCQSNLHLALELAQKHRSEAQTLREKNQNLQKQNMSKQYLINQLNTKIRDLEGINEKNINKYRKLKQKYKNLKKADKSHINLDQHKENRDENQQNNKVIIESKQFGSEQLPKNNNVQIDFYKQELEHKERIVKHLSNEIDSCEENTLNVLRLVDVLEQRIQELGMENNLLRGMVREREKSYETSGDMGYGNGSGVIFSQPD